MKRTIPWGILFSGITFLALLVLALLSRENFQSFGFGAEYGNIAASLASGEGYGQPFKGSSGLTAWMLPLNTFIYAAIFTVFGIKSVASIWACIVMSCLLWSVCAYYLYKIGHLVAGKFAVLTVALLWCFLRLNFGIAHSLDDIALINALTIATVYYLYIYFKFNKNYGVLLFLALVLPLVSPGLFLAFALILIFRFIYILFHQQKNNSGSYSFFSNPNSRIIYLGFVSIIALSVWSYRNYQALGVIIPSKSNFWYEFYQANIADEDGILNHRTFRTYHPGSFGKFRHLYDSLGEPGFADHMKQISRKELVLPDYLRRIGNRTKFAFIRSQNTNYHFPADTTLFSQADLKVLYKNGLVQKGNWIALDLDSVGFLTEVQGLELEQKEAVVADWTLMKGEYLKKEGNLKHLFREIAISLLPFICIVFGIFISSIRRSPVFQLVAAIYFIQILLYILVSHYSRYQYYLTGLQAVSVTFVASYLFNGILEMFSHPKEQVEPLPLSRIMPEADKEAERSKIRL